MQIHPKQISANGFHPYRCMGFFGDDGTLCAVGGQLHPQTAETFALTGVNVFALEVHLPHVFTTSNTPILTARGTPTCMDVTFRTPVHLSAYELKSVFAKKVETLSRDQGIILDSIRVVADFRHSDYRAVTLKFCIRKETGAILKSESEGIRDDAVRECERVLDVTMPRPGEINGVNGCKHPEGKV